MHEETTLCSSEVTKSFKYNLEDVQEPIVLFVRSRRRAARKYSGLRGSLRGGRGGGNLYNGLYGRLDLPKEMPFSALWYIKG